MKILGLEPLSPPISPERLPEDVLASSPVLLVIPSHATPKTPDLGVGDGRSGPSPSHPPLSLGERGLQGGEAGFPPFGHGGRRGGRRSAGTLSSRHLSPAACLTLFALLFPLFSVGGEGNIRLHLVIWKALVSGCSEGVKGSQLIGKMSSQFLLEPKKKKKKKWGERGY